jgi:uncharacterized protein (TIGR02444 family)
MTLEKLMDPLDNPFWQFSLQVYRCKDVKTSCLSLQEKWDINVNLLLFCAWLGYCVEPISHAHFTQACARIHSWQKAVTQPLRAIRRFIKSQHEDSWLKGFYQTLLQDEILSESYQQNLLFSFCKTKKILSAEKNETLAICYLHWLFKGLGLAITEDLQQQLNQFARLTRIAYRN